MLKDFKQSMTWRLGSASMDARITSKTWRVYEALTRLMIPLVEWLKQWRRVWWQKYHLNISSSMLMDWGWPGALSIIIKSFNGNPSFSKYSLTSRMKQWWNHSVNNTAVTHSFTLCWQKKGRNILLLFLRALMFFARSTTPGLIICQAVLSHVNSVSLSFHALNF